MRLQLKDFLIVKRNSKELSDRCSAFINARKWQIAAAFWKHQILHQNILSEYEWLFGFSGVYGVVCVCWGIVVS
jgi:hypothetical protein